jgi:cobalt-zinc-cadmium efflux system membrane fusion protein
MNMGFIKWITLAVATLVFFQACMNAPDEEAVTDNIPVGVTVTLTKEQFGRASITVGKPEIRTLSSIINARGMLIVNNSGDAIASTLIQGIVTDIFVRHGESISKGDPLCRLRHPSIVEVQQQYLEAVYDFQFAADNYERAKELRKENITSEKAFLKAESEFLLAKTSRQAALSTLQMVGIDPLNVEAGNLKEFIDIQSPISGRVNRIMAKIGSYVEINKELFEIVNLGEMLLQLKVFESDIPLIREGQAVEFSLSNLSDKIYGATIEATSSIMERGSRVLEVRARLNENIPDAFPGMFAAAQIKVKDTEALSIPLSAVVDEGGGEKYIFLLDSHSDDSYIFKKQSITTGIESGEFVELISNGNLDENTELVLSGVYYLKSEMLKELE